MIFGAVLLTAATGASAGAAACNSHNVPYISENISSRFSCHDYQDGTGEHYLVSDGWGIGGSADDFMFGALKAEGDLVVVARVASFQAPNSQAKSGIMIRAGLAANSRNVFVGLSSGNAALFQARTSDGGSTTPTQVAGITAPHWLKIEKRANVLRGFRSTDGITWTQIGTTTTLDFGNNFYVGVAASSGQEWQYNESRFERFSVTPIGTGGFINAAVGGPALTGTLTEATGTYTLRAAGSDIWGSRDQMQFAHQLTSGDRAIIARVASVQNTHNTAKAGVMIRESLEDFSPNAFMMVSPNSGVHLQSRTLSGAATTTATSTGTAPLWVKLEKRGTLVKGFRSSDGVTWTQVGNPVTLKLGRTYYLGLAATSHAAGTLGTSTFTNVQVVSLASDGFESQNIGTTGGSYSKSGGTHSVTAGGADIWGSSDQFRFAYQKRKGDHTIIARVASLGNTNAWAKAGIMIRTGLGANSRNAFLAISPSNGVTFQRRDLEGASTVSTVNAGVAVPYWLKLEKKGSTVKAFRASDGINWVQVGSTATLNLGGEFYMGLAVTSHNTSTTTTATFTDVLVAPGPTLSVLPISELGWNESMEQFAMDMTEVTEEEFVSTMVDKWGTAARGGRRGTLKPITNITWADALLYANARSLRDGFRPVYTFHRGFPLRDYQSPCASGTPGNACMLDVNTTVTLEPTALGYRLPTDAEWDFAATLVVNGPYRPNTSQYIWGLTEASETSSSVISKYAVWNTTAAADVGSRIPSQAGLTLFDMAGNAGEWTYEKNVRGGTWGSTTTGQVSWTAKVDRSALNYRDNRIGLRLVLPMVRRDAGKLSKQEKERFLNAVFTIKNTKYPGYSTATPEAERYSWWDWFALGHRLAEGAEYFNTSTGAWQVLPNLAHGTVGFLPWHREFVNQMEIALQSVDPRITIPVVNWGYGIHQGGQQASEESIYQVLSAYLTSEGFGLLGFKGGDWRDYNGFFDLTYPNTPSAVDLWWPLTETGPAPGWPVPLYVDVDRGASGFLVRNPSLAPPAVNMDEVLSKGLFSEFATEHEIGHHGTFHMTIGGNMSTMSSPMDPIFFLHHGEVDRIWAVWQGISSANVDPKTNAYAPPSEQVGLNMQDPVWPWSGSFYRHTLQITNPPPHAYPTGTKEIYLGDVIKRKMPKYSLN